MKRYNEKILKAKPESLQEGNNIALVACSSTSPGKP